MSRNPVREEAAAPAVRFSDVGMRYGRAPEVLKDITFSLRPGSLSLLTGASGAGKSSLLKLIYMAHKPSRGLITLLGEDIATLPRERFAPLRRRIGVVFQEFRLLEHLTAMDNVALPLRLMGQKPPEYRDDVAELLTWVGLGQRLHAMPATLSGGEKQRLAIARAVVGKPDVLLADEPTGNVDQEMGGRILRLFQELNRMGTTILIATHDRELVRRAGAPVLHLTAGRLARVKEPALTDAT